MEKSDPTLPLEEITKRAAEVAMMDTKVILIQGAAQQGKISIAIRALIELAKNTPGLYVCRMLSHSQTRAVALCADDPEVRKTIEELRKKRKIRLGSSDLLLDTTRSATKNRPISGAVVYCAESFGKYSDQISELVAATTGKVILATWTDNADMEWVRPHNPARMIAHTHRADYHERLLELKGHMTEADYAAGAYAPSNKSPKAEASSEAEGRFRHSHEPSVVAKDPYVHIDPGFINFRRCLSVFRNEAVKNLINDRHAQPNRLLALGHDHALVEYALRFCRANHVGTLSDILHAPTIGQLFCSVETLRGNRRVYDEQRVRFPFKFPFRAERRVFAEFGTEHFVADTGRSEAATTSQIAIVGVVARVAPDEITVHPIIMGGPTLEHPNNEPLGLKLAWEGCSWYETNLEWIDEFARCREHPLPHPDEWEPVMRALPEADVKTAICKLLGEREAADWGGEINDLFSAAVHLNGRRILPRSS